ncbi:NLR family CARD domain-containing protein 4 [Holothuria leucospilota]|uniref:NLR family CARD domain-containing protein 4 n=1 Tax=Holothuria leucospilota TaxID=206669 RepID=A0A9Q1HK13_HOLLE|nr:NLR family CARD domain-containing protein 4 [Holothuria leucospilota]
MESTISEPGARPETLPTGGDRADFESFLTDIKHFFINDEIQMLATALDLKPAERDKIERSKDSRYTFIHLLKRKGIISRTDISVLTEKLHFCGLHGVADDVSDSFKRFQLNKRPEPRETYSFEEKKTQFVAELKGKYNDLCGGIQPAPFLRDKYDIDKVFVENRIEFLEETQGDRKDKEKWTMLKDYKTIFTDPRIKSKRRIIYGEPGYGKSTLALQITYDWCQEIAPMTDFDILISLRLRQFRNVPTIYSAIKKFLLPKDSNLTENDIERVLESSATLILLDGYDEYPDRGKEDTDIELMIRGDMFRKHEVALTTRTSCLPPNCSHDTRWVRLAGFDDTSRATYIQNVMSHGCSDETYKISHFLKVNPVPADLCKIPLFFAMICYMVTRSEKFRNLKTVTQFFRHVIKCFHSHKIMKVTEGASDGGFDHSKLDKVAFEGLSGASQQISWSKNKLRDKIGSSLYDEYVRIGILIEEESFDYDSLEYTTETRFFHKLFAEWYGAHFLAKVTAQFHPEEFKSGPAAEIKPWSSTRNELVDTSQPEKAAKSQKLGALKNLNPNNVHYMYRYACGLDSDAGLKIINHLQTNEDYDQCTLMCITEWGGSLDTIVGAIASLCSREIHFSDRDSLLLQRSTAKLVEFASSQKIPILSVVLVDCLEIDSTGNLCVKPSKLSLPVIDSETVMWIYEEGLEITKEVTEGILQYLTKCLGLTRIVFNRCLFPRYIEVTECLSALRARNVKGKTIDDCVVPNSV